MRLVRLECAPYGLLLGTVDEWRIRVGDWRVIYRIDDGRLVVLVVPRKDVYR